MTKTIYIKIVKAGLTYLHFHCWTSVAVAYENFRFQAPYRGSIPWPSQTKRL